MTPTDEVVAAIGEVEKAVRKLPNDNALANQRDEKIEALRKLTELFFPQSNNAGEMRVPTEPGTTKNAGEMRVDSTTAPPIELPPIVANPTPPTTAPPPMIPAPPTPPTEPNPGEQGMETEAENKHEDETATYKQLTGNHGRKRRKSNRKKHKSAKLRENHATHTEYTMFTSRAPKLMPNTLHTTGTPLTRTPKSSPNTTNFSKVVMHRTGSKEWMGKVNRRQR
jgi:hypothetical protein